MQNNNSKFKTDNLCNDFNYHILSRNSDISNDNKYNSAKTTESTNRFSKKNNISQFKYDKLYFYEKERNFSIEMRKKQMKKKKINLKKISKFHHILMHSKIKTFSESADCNNLTLNNKTINISDINSTNLSNNINLKKILKNINIQKYNKEIDNMKNNNKTLVNKNITLDKTSNKSLFEETNCKNGETLKLILPTESIIKKKNIIISNKFKKPVKIVNYKFKNVFGNPNDNMYTKGQLCSYRYQNSLLSEQMKNKLKYTIINNVQKDYFQSQIEKFNTPINVCRHYEIFNETNKNYFLLFENLLKKYFGYLYNNIENEKYKLYKLLEQKETLKKDIQKLFKKINSEKDKKILLENLIKLLIKIRYNVDSLDKIPNEYLKKYGIMKGGINIKNENKITKKRNSMLITELKDKSIIKYLRKRSIEKSTEVNSKVDKVVSRKSTVIVNNDDYHIKESSIYKSQYPKKRNRDNIVIIPKIPIFNSANELDSKIRGIKYNLKELYKQVNLNSIIVPKLKLELNEINSESLDNGKIISNSFIKMENEEAMIQKEKYENYSRYKSYLLSSKNNYIEYNAQNSEKNQLNKTSQNKNSFPDKLITILLNLDIDIEIILKQKGIYKFLNSPSDTKIIYHFKEYNKTMFCVKILEIIFLYLFEEKKKYLSDDKTREKYLEFQEIIEKNNRLKKLEEKKYEDNKKRYLKEKKIMLKANKLVLLPLKKDDPYIFNLSRNKAFKIINNKRTKTENNNKIELILENEILF